MTYALGLFLIVAAITSAAIMSFKRGWVHFIFAKKILHISAISISAVSIFVVENTILLYILGGTLPLIFWLVYKGYFNAKNDQGHKSWGVFYFVAVFLALLLAFPKMPQNIFYPLIVLAFADGMATLVGYFIGKQKFVVGESTKSWEGSAAFFVSALVCFKLMPSIFPFIDPVITAAWALVYVCLFLTVLEAISPNGRDNIWIPTGVLFYILIDTSFIDGYSLLKVLAIAFFSLITIRLRWLSTSGAVVTALMGCFLIISPQPEWVMPAVVFFIIGSLISFLPNKAARFKHEPRTSFQVICNGGIFTFLIGLFFITSNQLWLFGGIAALATSMSDTASSEFGIRYGKKTYNILNCRNMAAGLSGGISVIGTAFGIIFLAFFCFIPFLILGKFDLKLYFILFVSGLSGNFIDSFLGSALQVKYRSPPSINWSDFPAQNANEQVRGYSIIDNNVVNLLSTSFASLLAIFLYSML